MVELNCNSCEHLKGGYCLKLHETLPNGFAKLFYGGASGDYNGKLTYASKCGVDKQNMNQKHYTSKIQVFVPALEVIPSQIPTQ